VEFGGKYKTVVLSSIENSNFKRFLKGWWVLRWLQHLGPICWLPATRDRNKYCAQL
jgi:hypothetical protein